MKQVFIVLLVVACVAFYLWNERIEMEKKAEAERITNLQRAEVTAMATKWNAVIDWESKLSNGQQYRLSPVLTVELERLWLTDRPIMFTGVVKDVLTGGNDNYTVIMEKSLIVGSEIFFLGTPLRLELECPPDMFESFLKSHPEVTNGPYLQNGVTVIASIESIQTKTITNPGDGEGNEGGDEDLKIGRGKCLDLLYTGSIRF